MLDIIIAKLSFPNDPTNNLIAHQMFVSECTDTTLNLYSVSSILGKEKRVYGVEKDDYLTIIHPEYLANGFKVPSFIDCIKMYSVSIDCTMKLSSLTQRKIDSSLQQRIIKKILDKKDEGKLTIYNISSIEFMEYQTIK